MSERILEVINLAKRYNDATQALENVSFYVEQGEFVGIMGPIGSGKSTLLNCISTIDRPTSGRVVIAGKDTGSLKPKELARFRREELGFVFQDANLLDSLTVRENIALALTIKHEPASEIPTRVANYAARLGISATLDKYPYEISGGQRQRAAAARAIIGRPHLVLADEPTGALDSKSARDLLETFSFMNSMGATLLMVTHDAQAASWCDRIIFIKDGTLAGQLTRGNLDRRTFYNVVVDATSRMAAEADANADADGIAPAFAAACAAETE